MLKKYIASAILFGICCAPVAALGQQNDHRDDHGQQSDHHDDQRNNHQYVRHQEWRKGYHMRSDDWNRGQRVDYRTYHLRQPPAGYEWREVDGNYVMAAVTTGIIASVIAASAAH